MFKLIRLFIFLFLCFCFLGIFNLALASGTTGSIDNSHRYAWSENLGWIDFGSSQGNVQVTDSELTGYAWLENGGWLNLNPSQGGVSNTVNGELSGYAWGENIGWVNFNPTNGGVTIDSNGYFSGYAWGENTGWIIFNCSDENTCASVDYKVKTDWITKACGNGLVEGDEECDDGNTVSNDGCDSSCQLEDSGGAGPALPTNSPQISSEQELIPSLLINNGDFYTDSLEVKLSFEVEEASQMAISNSEDFSQIGWEPYQSVKNWLLIEGQGLKYVYAKFRSEQGGVSETVSDSILVDFSAPLAPEIDSPQEKEKILEKEFWAKGKAEAGAKVIIQLDDFYTYQVLADSRGAWSYLISAPIKDGAHYLKVFAQDQAGRESESDRVDFFVLTEQFESEEEIKKEVKSEKESEEAESEAEEKTKPEGEDLISEEAAPRIPEIVDRLPEQVRRIPAGPQFNLIEEISQAISQQIIFPAWQGIIKTAQAIFIDAPRFVAKKFVRVYQMVELGIKRLAILFNPPELPELSQWWPIKKQVSQPDKIIEQKIPAEKVFFSSHYGNLSLPVSEQNQIDLVAGARIKAFIKPDKDKRVKQIKAKLILSRIIEKDEASPFSWLGAKKAKAAEKDSWIVGEYIFRDADQDGIYETDLQIPPTSGEYSLETIIEYIQEEKQIQSKILAKPKGYVYFPDQRGEIRIEKAKLTLYWLNPMTYQWQEWPAYPYGQENPYLTDKTGEYYFLVPSGEYYLKVEKQGYQAYRSEKFEVKAVGLIVRPIELKL